MYSPMLHLFDRKHSKNNDIVKYFFTITILYFKMYAPLI